jgi:DUF4097 and DUF4098 domain-containing protein YvlB
MRRFVAAAALVVCSGCVDIVGARFEDMKIVEREDKRFSTTDTPDVNLSTFDGAIEIRPWDKPEVEVVIEKRGPSKESLADLAIDATQSGSRINVDVRLPRRKVGWFIGASPSAKLIVSVPARSNVVAKSGDGSIDVERITGRVELTSGDGNIRASDLAGDVNVHTGDGSIVLDGAFGGLRARSGDGSVRIHAARSSAPGDWEITTGDGSIALEVAEGFNADLDAHTGDGRVRIEDLEVTNSGAEKRRDTVKGRIGSGGRLVRLRTGDGSITLRR